MACIIKSAIYMWGRVYTHEEKLMHKEPLVLTMFYTYTLVCCIYTLFTSTIEDEID